MNKEKPIVVNLPEGQNTLTILQGEAPAQLDNLAPLKIDIVGTITAPLNFLDKRVNDIDQHKAHIIVNRDKLTILLVFAEDDAYAHGSVLGALHFSEIFTKLGINSNKGWQPEQLGQFLKLHRSFFVTKEENMKVVSALKSFDAKVNQTVQRETKENGNRALSFRQAVDSNIPESFKLKIPIFSGDDAHEIDVETYASVDGTDVTIHLQSAGANDVTEEVKANVISDVIGKIRDIAPEIVIIEQ
ncbi:MAG: DUF2303 family protein [Prevotella sp.]|nr:DUF2303 family protein [Prevotella sp.]